MSQRYRMRWLCLLSLVLNVSAAEVTSPELTPEEELKEIVTEMIRMETCLRLDRTDETVQLRGKEINERLEKLIKEVEAARITSKMTERQKQLLHISGVKPIIPEKVKPPPDPYRAPIDKFDYSRSWANLPNINRDRIIQSMNNEIPLKWRLRISAYFISVAAEEVAPPKPPLKK